MAKRTAKKAPLLSTDRVRTGWQGPAGTRIPPGPPPGRRSGRRAAGDIRRRSPIPAGAASRHRGRHGGIHHARRTRRPAVLVWDNVRIHLTAPLREFIAANPDWLTVFQLPSYAPDLNPQEGIWSMVKRDIGNLAAADLSQITRAVKRRLKQTQYRPDLIDGCLTGTGLIMDD